MCLYGFFKHFKEWILREEKKSTHFWGIYTLYTLWLNLHTTIQDEKQKPCSEKFLILNGHNLATKYEEPSVDLWDLTLSRLRSGKVYKAAASITVKRNGRSLEPTRFKLSNWARKASFREVTELPMTTLTELPQRWENLAEVQPSPKHWKRVEWLDENHSRTRGVQQAWKKILMRKTVTLCTTFDKEPDNKHNRK